MTSTVVNGISTRIPKPLATLALILAAVCVCRAQNPALLQISSPVTGTVLNPGQSVTISVTSPANATFTQVFVVGDGGIGATQSATSVPAQLSLPMPSQLSLGPHMLTASGATSGQVVQSATTLVDVERADLPQNLSANASDLIFSAQGQRSPVVIFAKFNDGSFLDVTASSYTSYSSSNTNVATVDNTGLVTAIGPGTATVTVTYTVSGQNAQTTVPITVPPAVLVASPSSLAFGPQAVGTTSSTQQMTLQNVSSQQVNISTLAMPGGFSETDNCAGTTLAPGNSCTLNVSFAPTAGAAASGWMTVNNDTTTEAPAFALTGTGTPSACISNLNGSGTAGGRSAPRIDLTWSAQSGATSYDVLRTTASSSPYYVLLGNVSSPAYSDRGGILTNGSTYYYVVRPVGSSGETCQSNQASITIP